MTPNEELSRVRERMAKNEELSQLLEPRETLPEPVYRQNDPSPLGAWHHAYVKTAEGLPTDEIVWRPMVWDDEDFFAVPVLLKALEARGIHDWGVNGVSGRGGARPTIDADVGDSTTNDIVEIAATDVDDIPRALRDAALAALRKEAT